uniref:glucuronosyltransferase n=1 Tax=Steinernema glaseri TaxID=37863 RepID=A0A1I7YR82_9BILA
MAPFWILVLLMASVVHGAKILFYVPTLSYSHVAFNSKVADLLAARGHNVTMLIARIDPAVRTHVAQMATVRTISLPNLKDGVLANTLWRNPGPFDDSSPLNPKITSKLFRVASIFIDACRVQATDLNLASELAEQRFDVGVVEQYDSCGFGVFEALGLKNIVWLSATGVFRPQPHVLGVEHPLSYVPELFGFFDDSMNFFQRLQNYLIAQATGQIHGLYSRSQETQAFRKAYKKRKRNFPDLLDVSQSTDTVLVNSLPLIDFPMPTSSEIHGIGGITVEKEAPPLMSEWQEIADHASGGFWLVTFGSIAKTSDMPSKMRKSLFNAFSQFSNFTFIVKYETLNSTTLQIAPNVIFTKWIPQLSLMAHPNYHGIITHGGWSSILESLVFKKPMILMPLFADHTKNSKIIEQKKLGLIVDKMRIREDTFVAAIRTLTADERYYRNCARYSAMLGDSMPISVDDLIVHKFTNSIKPTRRKFERHPFQKDLSYVQENYIDLCSIFVVVLLYLSLC